MITTVFTLAIFFATLNERLNECEELQKHLQGKAQCH